MDRFSVRVFQAVQQNNRTLAKMLRASGGEIPPEMKPRELKTFQVHARSFHLARQAVEEQLTRDGLQVRSINRGLREFIVYVSHPEDLNVTPNP